MYTDKNRSEGRFFVTKLPSCQLALPYTYGMISSMNDLNSSQKQAVEHTGSPLLIIAGAGTGKTTVITRKIAWLVEQKLAQPNEILALTFTDKAAGEMEERVDQLLPYGYFDLWIQTFHSFGEKILRQYALDIGIPGNFKVINDYQQWGLVKKNLDRFTLAYYRPLGTPTKFIGALLQHFSRAKDELVTPAEYREYVAGLRKAWEGGGEVAAEIQAIAGLKNEPDEKVIEQELRRLEEVAGAYEVYQQLLLENERLDFGDVINYTLRLCQERPAVLQQLQERFKYLLVDEFQDTNYAQYELVRLLAGKGETLTVVGDDDQAIFRFRGASMSNILQFKHDYPQAQDIVLTQNYRSAQNILDLAYRFIQLNNPNRLEVQLNASYKLQVTSSKKLDKRLVAATSSVGEIEVLTGTDLQDEITKVVEKIAALKTEDREATWNDFAVLVRANAAAADVTAALDLADFPYIFLAARGLYARPAIMDVIAYLNLLDNYHESTALYRVLTMPVFKFTHEEIMDFVAASRRKAHSLYDVLTRERGEQTARARKTVRLLDLIDQHTLLAKTRGPFEVMLRFLADSGYTEELERNGNEQTTREIARELELFGKRIKRFEAEVQQPRLKGFLAELNLELEAGEEGALAADPNAGPEMIKILTVHAAKGLEFKYVFIINLVDLRFPTTERKDPIALPEKLIKETVPPGDAHLEEERRLFYVAMTRAKRGLYFSWAPDYGGARPKKPSRFLLEAGLLTVGEATGVAPVAEKEERRKSTRPDPFRAGARGILPLPTYTPPKIYSFTQLQSYDKCPYSYYQNHILKLPKPGKHFFSFGQTLHLALQKFFQARLAAAPAQTALFGSPPKEPTLADLHRLYEENWIDDWYQSARDKERYRQQGYEALEKFWQLHDGNWPRVIGLEQGFRVRIGGHTIQGKIDRIDELPDGTVRIVDYKTGRTKSRNDLGSARYQLFLYQLAAQDVLGKQPSELQFYYLEENVPLNLKGTPKDLEKLQEWVQTTIQGIETSCATGVFIHSSDPCRFCTHKDVVGEILEV